MKIKHFYRTWLPLAAIVILTTHPAAAEKSDLLYHYPLDGTLSAKGGGSPLAPAPNTGVFYAEEGPAGQGESVLFGKDPENETQRLMMPKSVTLPVEAGAISFWVKVPQMNPDQAAAFILHAPGFDQQGAGITSGCYISVNGKEEAISWQLAGSGKVIDSLADLSEWTHLVITWNASQQVARMYINGEESAERAIPQGPEFNTVHPIRLGGFAHRPEADPQDNQLSGMISDLRIYEGDLTEADIATLSQP